MSKHKYYYYELLFDDVFYTRKEFIKMVKKMGIKYTFPIVGVLWAGFGKEKNLTLMLISKELMDPASATLIKSGPIKILKGKKFSKLLKAGERIFTRREKLVRDGRYEELDDDELNKWNVKMIMYVVKGAGSILPLEDYALDAGDTL